MSEQELEEILQLLESTASLLRGMTMDPAIPQHAKSAMWARIATLEAVVAQHAA